MQTDEQNKHPKPSSARESVGLSRGSFRGKGCDRGSSRRRGLRTHLKSTTGSSRGNPPPHKVNNDKQIVSVGFNMYPRYSYFQVLCSNRAIPRLCSIVFRSLLSRDYRMAVNLSELQLQYVTCLAYINRLLQCGIRFGYFMNSADSSSIKRIAETIQLPSVLAKYIESLGTYQLLCGATIAPWVADYQDLFRPDLEQRSPRAILTDAARPIPENVWAIDTTWVIDWNLNTTHRACLSMGFRKVENVVLDGESEIAVTPILDGNTYKPTSPQVLTDVEGRLGAIYEFRNRDNAKLWPGLTTLALPHMFSGSEFDVQMEWSNIVARSNTSRDV